MASISVTFPDQAAIVAYLENHPLKNTINTDFIASALPNSMQKVAQYFSGKAMLRDEIKSNIENALSDPAEIRIRKSNRIDALVYTPPQVALAVIFFEQIMKDLLEHATYVRSASGNWIRLTAL